jgi:hypothetical protein
VRAHTQENTLACARKPARALDERQSVCSTDGPDPERLFNG